MTILWCGGEDIDFECIGNIDFYTSQDCYDPNYSRHAIEIAGGTLLSPPITPFTSMWLHVLMFNNNPFFGRFGFHNSTSGAFIGCYAVATGEMYFGTYDGSSYNALSDILSGKIVGTRETYDIQLVNYGSNGTVNIFKDKTLINSYTGDLTVLSETELDQVTFYDGSSLYKMFCSEIIIADEDTRGMHLLTLVPDSAGDNNDWNGTYVDVDDRNEDDLNYIYTDVASNNVQFGVTGITGTDKLVRMVKVTSKIAQPSGSLGIKHGIKTNSALHLSSEITPETYFNSHEVYYTVNPETTNPFTSAELDALQIAFQSQ